MSKKLFVIVLALLFLCCKDDGITPPTNPLQLTVEDVSCVEATLKISLAGGQASRTVTVKRNDSVVTTITLTTVDTLVTDVNLQPKNTYTYTANAGSWKTSVQITTLDTTSHTIHWQAPDTLGVYGLIRDVWVFSRDNAWAVGEIILPDSTGKPDMSNPYNAAHWDGNKWEIKKITVNFHGNIITPPLNGIFAFSQTDIWLSSGVPVHGNGDVWTQYHLYDMGVLSSNDGSINKLWGINSSDLFFVGNKGTIVHYFNGTWTKMESHTTVDLQDIWGIDNEHVWATGTNIGDGHSVVLQYNGKQWTTIYDNTNKPPNEKFGFRSVWTDRIDKIFLVGDAYSSMINLNTNKLQLLNNNLQKWVATRIRATNRRDIFQVGNAGETIHFNGLNWHLYPELFNAASARFFTIFPTNDFIFIGGYSYTGLNGIPIVIRGYR